jgi:hypothetical protein
VNLFTALNKREQGLISEKDLMHGHICNNIRHGRSFKTIFKDKFAASHGTTITHLFTRVNQETGEAFAITMDKDQIIKRWNLNTGKFEWGYRPKSDYGSMLEKGNLCLSEKTMIYYGGTSKTDRKYYNEIIGLTEGKSKFIQRTDSISKICTSGNKVFQIEEIGISEHDLTTNRYDWHIYSAAIELPNKEIPESERFLVNCDEKTVIIYDRIKHKKTEINLLTLDPTIISISCTYLQAPYLYCGFKTIYGEPNVPAFCVIDLEKGEVIDVCRTDRGKASFSSVESLLVDHGRIYFGNSSGELIAVHLTNKKEEIISMGQHSWPGISYLALQNGILISGSPSTSGDNAVLSFWDTKTMKLLKTMEFPQLKGLCFAGDKVLALVDKYLMQWDFQCHHEGEVLTPESLQEEPKIENPLRPIARADSDWTLEHSEALSSTCSQQ